MRDLSADADHASTLAELRGRLEAWMRETGDPLLDGPIPLPPGTVANDPAQSSPNDPMSAGPGNSPI